MPISPAKIALNRRRQSVEWVDLKVYKFEAMLIDRGLMAMDFDLFYGRKFDFDEDLEVYPIPLLVPKSNLTSRVTEVEAIELIEPSPRPLPKLKLLPRNQKWCARCGEYVDKDKFHKDASRRDGLANWCKPCKNEHQRKVYWGRKEPMALPKAA